MQCDNETSLQGGVSGQNEDYSDPWAGFDTVVQSHFCVTTLTSMIPSA